MVRAVSEEPLDGLVEEGGDVVDCPSGHRVAVAGMLGAGAAGPALADTGNFGQQVRMCAHTVLSSLSVVPNANRLRRFSSPRIAAPAADVAQPALAQRGH